MRIELGMHVEVMTANGDRLEVVALSPVTNGRDLKIVWVAELDEYAARGDACYRIPWPADAVRELSRA